MLDDITRTRLTEAGVDMEDALNRFMGKDDFLVMILKKLDQDNNYQLYKMAMAVENYEEAFNAAHALKGVTGNLSIMPLYRILCEEVEYLRHHEYEKAKELAPAVINEYDRVLKIFDEL